MHVAGILGPGKLARPLAAFRHRTKSQWTSLIEQADVILVFGGDGTIHRNLSALVELGVPVLVIPCGSGNDFARALGLRSVRDSLAAWELFSAGHHNVRSIDLGVIQPIPTGSIEQSGIRPKTAVPYNFEPQYFCCVAGVGLDAEITRRANALPRWLRAHGGYGISAPPEFLRFTPFPMKVCPNGFTPRGFEPTTLAAVANAPAYGGGMKIAPNAKLDDGKLDVCVVRALDKLSLFCLFPTVYFGRHLSSEKVEYAQTETARIEAESALDVYADGEYVCKTPVEFKIAHKALQVVVPG
jgi:diacylglycerol kinase (ATP)